ncbi:MAG: sel1 repeat family protein [Firmicutes bacterium]|nr:sel1 repeat family protein [Bacillota bacterium]MCL1953978.1 sel1 repeat family protein [Bacillota bacterium]
MEVDINIQQLVDLAESGDTEAQVKLASVYRNGVVVDKDFEKSFQLFLKAAQSGHAHAQYNLALRYYNGQGVAKDFKQATLWFAKAADQGHVQALYALGFRYLNGDGVAKDTNTALEIFEKVAEKGLAYAQYNLGKQYCELGQYINAVSWLQKAVEQDYAQSCTLLATLYEQGRGVPQDMDRALELRDKASKLIKLANNK